MLLRLVARFSNGTRFANEQGKVTKSQGQIDSNLQDILNERRRIRQSIAEIEKQNLPIQQMTRAYYDSIVNITLYMRNDYWQSQYLHLLLNYNKLGFRRVSDLVQLDRASYLLNLRKVQDEERWPSIKVVIALQPKIILSGISSISQFFRENGYFNNDYDRHSSQIESLKQFIDKDVLSYMESLFWHPTLTFQYSFHTNISSYIDTSRSNNIYGILGRNGAIIISRIFKNLVKIAKENERYSQSRQKFTSNLKELASIYLKDKPFFGGDKPNHVDFYLMAQLRTKSGSKLFVDYLQKNISGQFWSWWMRLSNLCQYNVDRVTTI